MTKISQITGVKYWVFLALLGFVWGSSFILIKKGYCRL